MPEHSPLTPQQLRVLRLIEEKMLNKQIAYALGITEATVKAHVSAILTKLDVARRSEAVAEARQRGLIDVPSHLESRGPGTGCQAAGRA